MGVAHGENKRLTGKIRIDVVCQFLGHDLVERYGDDLLVEFFNIKANFVGRSRKIDLAGTRIDQLDLFTLFELDSGLC